MRVGGIVKIFKNKLSYKFFFLLPRKLDFRSFWMCTISVLQSSSQLWTFPEKYIFVLFETCRTEKISLQLFFSIFFSGQRLKLKEDEKAGIASSAKSEAESKKDSQADPMDIDVSTNRKSYKIPSITPNFPPFSLVFLFPFNEKFPL